MANLYRNIAAKEAHKKLPNQNLSLGNNMEFSSVKLNTECKGKADKSTSKLTLKDTNRTTATKSSYSIKSNGENDPAIEIEAEEIPFTEISHRFNLQHEYDKIKTGEMTKEVFQSSIAVQKFIIGGLIFPYQLQSIIEPSVN